MPDNNLDNQFRETVASVLRDWVRNLPPAERDRPIIGGAVGGTARSLSDIAREVEQRTSYGNKLVERWAKLAMEHVSRSMISAWTSEGPSGTPPREATEPERPATVERAT